jgi:hypothetical protein
MEVRATAWAVLLAGAIVLVLCATPAAAKTYAPPRGQAFHGVSDTGALGDFWSFADQVDAHPAVLQEFFHWDVPLRSSGALYRWTATDTRGVLSLSTALGSGEELITPRQIANGRGDHYLLRLNESIASSGQTVYIRLMPEMNGHWNAYSAYNLDGSRRSGGHATRWFKQAWRRSALIVRGGSRRKINHRLHRQGMPRIARADWQDDPIYEELGIPEELPRPRVALMWVPQSFGSPNVAGNQPADYWPGGRYVDWVGFDVFAKFRSAFDDDQRFYRAYRHKPVVVGEYSPWDNDQSGAFTHSLFTWAKRHKRVKMLIYYRSVTPDNPHNLQFYPGAKTVLRHTLNKHRYRPYAAGAAKLPDEPPPPPPPPPAP